MIGAAVIVRGTSYHPRMLARERGLAQSLKRHRPRETIPGIRVSEYPSILDDPRSSSDQKEQRRPFSVWHNIELKQSAA